jgi:hypothetical protein
MNVNDPTFMVMWLFAFEIFNPDSMRRTADAVQSGERMWHRLRHHSHHRHEYADSPSIRLKIELTF